MPRGGGLVVHPRVPGATSLCTHHFAQKSLRVSDCATPASQCDLSLHSATLASRSAQWWSGATLSHPHPRRLCRTTWRRAEQRGIDCAGARVRRGAGSAQGHVHAQAADLAARPAETPRHREAGPSCSAPCDATREQAFIKLRLRLRPSHDGLSPTSLQEFFFAIGADLVPDLRSWDAVRRGPRLLVLPPLRAAW